MAAISLAHFGKLVQHYPERYTKSFKSFLDAFEMSNDMYYLSYESKVPDSVLYDVGAEVRVLGIGAGSGQADSIILKKILQRHDRVYNRVVEPSDMIQRYKVLVSEDASFSAVNFDWRQQTAEEYFQTSGSEKFHLVHAIHVLYYVDDPDTTLRSMWEQLEDGGCMVVAMESDKSDLVKLQDQLWDCFGQGVRLKTSFRTSADVKQWLNTMGINYVTSEDEFRMNVQECFQEESEAGVLLLDFLTETPYVSNEPEIKSTALEYIRSNSSVVDDKVLLTSVKETIVAFKMATKGK